ncbi:MULTISPECIES: DUF3016 domain-containing protein [Pseudoalteromonas]|uniref:DUF3016 domain-containing protein n=1 Tax=Pseudoalteromonas amylolytica TaxID=1859457 RepID=A0A1S1MNA1_9GAMM|nr:MULTISPECIES: DUF3016 domain-containing protein [Pseudoalteromonas]OHU86216.1 hypothetical protein BFC16_16060 [Pseudoalteromonas sp. JW3]OHU89678.1 hypothetical protein BET10_16260 [Pseudoalteromonas amylolytica]
MNKLVAITVGIFSTFAVHAGEAQVTFKDFKDYRDVKPSNEARGSYHKRIASQLEKHITKLAEQLPEGYKLEVTFDDIDLAGDVRFNADDLRIVKPIYFPRLDISYSLVDGKGMKLLADSDVNLKDMSFMDRARIGHEESFYHEKRLLSEWFSETIMSAIESE